MGYNHLSIDERTCLQFYYVQGLSVRKISKLLNRSPSTISREIRRNCWQLVRGVFYYYATTAQRKAKRRKRFCHRGTYFSEEVKAYIEQKLASTWSPEQIANTPCNLKLPSASTIYRLIYEKYIVNGNLKYLRRKGKSRVQNKPGRKGKRGKSIRKRPKHIYNRKEFGHWEIDTVQPGTGKGNGCFVSMAERKTRYYIVVKVENRTAEAVKNAVIKTLKSFPQGTVKTITTDNGTEFSKWKEIEDELKTKMYFTDPYCAWQKGTNENLNGLLRGFYPKGRSLARVSAKTLANNVAKINNRPKKVLNFHTPADLFEQELDKLLHLT